MRKTARMLVLLILSALSFWAGADGSGADVEMKNLLFSWTVQLSGYPKPKVLPIIEYKPHAYFVKNACNEKECKVIGWYPNTGNNIVYVDEKCHEILFDGSDGRSLLCSSIIVHEMVHYLQAVGRVFASYECKDAIALEREAYAVQRAYILAYGRYLPVGLAMHKAGCKEEAEVRAGLQHEEP